MKLLAGNFQDLGLDKIGQVCYSSKCREPERYAGCLADSNNLLLVLDGDINNQRESNSKWTHRTMQKVRQSQIPG